MSRPFAGSLRSRSPRRSQEVWKIIFLIIAIIALAIAFVILQLKSEQHAVVIDDRTLCCVDRPPAEVVVVLLDVTSHLSEAPVLQIRSELQRVRSEVAEHGRIEVYTVRGDSDRVTAPLLQLCNPGNGARMNALYQNPLLARRKWEAFSARLDAEMARVLREPDAAHSPIFESIQAAALRTFNIPVHDNVSKRLVVVSDMMQNVPGSLSMYEGIPAFEAFKATRYFASVRADLRQVEVTILYLVRPGVPQPWPAHYRFWEDYFRAQGAVLNQLVPVYGAR